MTGTEHIVKAVDQELSHLDNMIAEMGGLAERQLQEAVAALVDGDVERAEAVVEQVKASYDGRLESELEELLDEFETMQAEGRLDLDQLHDRVHEIRGEAGTFGYPLVSEIGRLLCELLAPMDQVGEAEKQAIETHLRAIQTVVTRKVKGTGPDVAKQIVEGLRVMAEKTLA